MNQVFLDLGIIKIYWYSIILFVAFFVGGALAIKESKKWKISEDFMINMFFYLIPISLIGARIYYVLFNLDYYSNNLLDIFKVWEGGLAIHGGLIAALLFIIIYSKKYKITTLRITDILVVSLILGQAIGRWGNFFNSEAHGPITSLEFLQSIHIPNFIIEGLKINGVYYQPTFLYESILCFIGFIILIIIRRSEYLKIGQLTSLYLIYYGVIRFFIESLRTDSLMIIGLKAAQIVSIIMIIIGIIMLIKLKKGSIFVNKYNDTKNIDKDIF
ncbi:MAG: prolipoprotein diacylglyceryl transferase [Bacilli bacterium]